MEQQIIFSRPQTARMREALTKTMENIEIKKLHKEKEERLHSHNKMRPLSGQKDLILRRIKRKIDDILNNKTFKKIQMEEKKMELRKVKLLGKIVNLLEHSIVLSPEELLLYRIEFKHEKTKKKLKVTNKKNKQMKFSHNLNYFSEIGITFRYEDVYYTPTEFIQKNFTDSEKRLMVLDPKYFLLHKPPFDNVDLKLKYTLTSKIQEEEEKIRVFEKKKKEKKKEPFKKSLSIVNRKNSIFYPVLNYRNSIKNNYLTLDTDLSSDINYSKNNLKSTNRILTASTRPITASNNINKINLFKNCEDDENNIFRVKINKTPKFLYVPKPIKKKKRENRTFEDFERRKKLIQDERQYFRKKKVNDYKELKERNRKEILKEHESKKEVRNIITEIEKNYFESNHMK